MHAFWCWWTARNKYQYCNETITFHSCVLFQIVTVTASLDYYICFCHHMPSLLFKGNERTNERTFSVFGEYKHHINYPYLNRLFALTDRRNHLDIIPTSVQGDWGDRKPARVTLTHILVPHICVNELGQHWFRLWHVACSAPSCYLNQCWLIVNWSHRNKLRWNYK